MTRAETIAAIKTKYVEGGCHDPEHRPLDCADCTIAWLLQEIDYMNARLEVAIDLVGLLNEGL